MKTSHEQGAYAVPFIATTLPRVPLEPLVAWLQTAIPPVSLTLSAINQALHTPIPVFTVPDPSPDHKSLKLLLLFSEVGLEMPCSHRLRGPGALKDHMIHVSAGLCSPCTDTVSLSLLHPAGLPPFPPGTCLYLNLSGLFVNIKKKKKLLLFCL